MTHVSTTSKNWRSLSCPLSSPLVIKFVYLKIRISNSNGKNFWREPLRYVVLYSRIVCLSLDIRRCEDWMCMLYLFDKLKTCFSTVEFEIKLRKILQILQECRWRICLQIQTYLINEVHIAYTVPYSICCSGVH